MSKYGSLDCDPSIPIKRRHSRISRQEPDIAHLSNCTQVQDLNAVFWQSIAAQRWLSRSVSSNKRTRPESMTSTNRCMYSHHDVVSSIDTPALIPRHRLPHTDILTPNNHRKEFLQFRNTERVSCSLNGLFGLFIRSHLMDL